MIQNCYRIIRGGEGLQLYYPVCLRACWMRISWVSEVYPILYLVKTGALCTWRVADVIEYDHCPQTIETASNKQCKHDILAPIALLESAATWRISPRRNIFAHTVGHFIFCSVFRWDCRWVLNLDREWRSAKKAKSFFFVWAPQSLSPQFALSNYLRR